MAESFQDIGLKIVLLGVREFDANANKVEKNIDQMNRSMDKTGTSASKASQGIDTVSTKTDKAGRSFKETAAHTESFATKLSSLGSRVTLLGAALTAGLTIPLNMVRNQLIGAGIEFEDAFANVGKTVDGIIDDFGKLTPEGEKFRKSLIDMSLELPITVNELSAVAAAAGQVGIPFGENGEILREFTKIAAEMGVATNITAEDSAIAMARVANIYGIAAEDMIEFSRGFSSAIVALGNNTAASEQEILNMTLRLAPAASLANITTAETLALAASMTEMGIQAEAGGTAMSTLLLTMSEASKTAGAGQDVFTASNEKMQEGLTKLRQLLASGVTDLTELEYALQGTGLNLEGVSGMLGKMDTDFSSVNTSIEKTQNNIKKYNNDLTRLRSEKEKLRAELAAGNITQDQYNKKLTSLNKSIDGVKTSLANAELSLKNYNNRSKEMHNEMVSIDDIIKHVSMNTMMDMNEAMEKATTKTAIFADILGVSEEEFAAAFGAKPIETMVRFLSNLADLQDEGKVTEETLTELGFSGIRVRTVFNSLGPNIATLTGNVELSNDAWIKQTALQVEVQKKFATTKAQIQLMKNAVTALGIAVFDYVKPSFDAMIKATTELINKFREFFQASDKNADMISKLFIAASLLGPALLAVGAAMKTIAILSKSGIIGDTFGPLISLVTSPLLLGGLATIAAGFVAFKLNLFGVGDAINEIIRKIRGFAAMEQSMKGEALDLSDKLRIVARVLSDEFIPPKVLSALKQMSSSIKRIRDSLDKFTVVDISLSNAFKDLFSGDIEGAIENFKLTWDSFSTWFKLLGKDLLSEEFNNIKDVVVPAVEDAANWITTTGVPAVVGALTSLYDAISNWITTTIPKVTSAISEVASAFWNWASEVIPNILPELAKITGRILGWVTGIALLIPGAMAAIGIEIINWAKTIDVGEALTSLKDIGSDLVDSFVEGFTQGLQDIVGAANGEDILSTLQGIFESEAFGIAAGLFKSTLDNVTEGIAGFVNEISKIKVGGLIAIAAVVGGLWASLAGVSLNAIAKVLPTIGIGIRFLVNALGDLAQLDFQGAWDDLMTGLDSLSEQGIVPAIVGLTALYVVIQSMVWPAIVSLAATIFGPFISAITALIGPLLTVVTALWGWASAAIAAAIPTIALALPFIALAAAVAVLGVLIYAIITNTWGMRDAFEKGVQGMWTAVKGIVLIGKFIVEGIIDGLKWFVDGGFERWIKQAFKDLINWVKEILGISSPSSVFFDIGVAVLQGLWDGIKSLVVALMTWLGERTQQMLDIFKNILGDVWEFGKNVIQNIWDGIKSLWDSFIAFVGEKVTWFVNVFKNSIADILQFGKDVISNIKSGIIFGWDAFIAFIQEKANLIKGVFSGLASGMLQLGKDLVNNLKQGILDVWDDFKKEVMDLFNSIPYLGKVIGRIGSPSAVMEDIGRNYMLGLKVGMDAISPDILNSMANTFKSMVGEAEIAVAPSMMSAALGSTVTTNTMNTSNISNSNTFAPVIQGVPMKNEQSAGREILNAYRSAQLINGG